MDDVLQGGYYESPSGYNNVDWFVDEIVKLESKMDFFFKNTEKDTITTHEDEEHFRRTANCRLCDKKVLVDKIRDRCDLTGK